MAITRWLLSFSSGILQRNVRDDIESKLTYLQFPNNMNVFVLSTGRCGSNTFARACQHIDNYSAGHESKMYGIRDRVKYPNNHVEIDNRLSWFLGRLDRRYGDDAFYVHLRRNRDDTAESLARRYNTGIMKAYKERIIWRADDAPTVSPLDVCKHFCDTVNSNINLFLKDKSRCMEFWLHSAGKDFREFWGRIRAEGDLSAALEEWNQKYNASEQEEAPDSKEATDKPSLMSRKSTSFPVRASRKVVRVVRKLPDFLRAA